MYTYIYIYIYSRNNLLYIFFFIQQINRNRYRFRLSQCGQKRRGGPLHYRPSCDLGPMKDFLKRREGKFALSHFLWHQSNEGYFEKERRKVCTIALPVTPVQWRIFWKGEKESLHYRTFCDISPMKDFWKGEKEILHRHNKLFPLIWVQWICLKRREGNLLHYRSSCGERRILV